MNIVDRISPLSILLDDVFYQSTIKDMRDFYFFATKSENKWFLFSDYYFGDEKPNKVISFTVMPSCPYILEMNNAIKAVASKDIKNSRSINPDFVSLINLLPIINIVFIFDNKNHFIWNSITEAKEEISDYIKVIHAYVEYWRDTEPATMPRLNKISKNLKLLENLINRGKKLRIISAMYLIAQLGGYVGSLITRETELSSLLWFSDRDSTNEIGNNLIRDLFQISLIDVAKKNIDFSFTTANSGSNEWYKEATRIPDYITGAVSGFNFSENMAINQKTAQMLGLHFKNNTKNTFLFKFKLDSERIRLQRMLISTNIKSG